VKKRTVIHVVLSLCYSIFLIYLVLYSQGFGRVASIRDYNLVPLKTINNYIQYRQTYGEMNFFINIYGNILAFMPMGYFIFIFEKRHRLYKGLLLPFIASLLIEIAQIKMGVGSFDVDDIILNTLGGLSIYFLLFCVFSFRKWMKKGKNNEKSKKKQ